jgi:hypothetical protein
LTESNKALQVYNSTQRELDDATKTYTTLLSGGADADDPAVQQAKGLIDSIQGQLDELGSIRSNAISAMQNGSVAASAVGAASGNNTTVPPTKNAGSPVEGQTGISKSGKPIIFKGGKWVYN